MRNVIAGIIIVIAIGAVLAALFRPSTFDFMNRQDMTPVSDDTTDDMLDETDMPIDGETDATSPIDRAKERVTKKPFGILIDPVTSPVQPERFRGYHTGTDFEAFPEELQADVPIRAMCMGAIIVKRHVAGYGGVIVQRCDISGEPVTVLYGHLALSSITPNLGDAIDKGSEIGLLGADKSPDTDGERKHLHLGVHRGTDVDTRGYVDKEQALFEWIDPCAIVCQ